jgi:hypothetical protein
MVRYIITLFILLHIHQKVNGQNIFPAPVANKWGFINTAGQWVLQPLYSEVKLLDNIIGYTAYDTVEKTTSFIVSNGKIIHKSNRSLPYIQIRKDILSLPDHGLEELIIDTNGNKIGKTTYRRVKLPKHTNLIIVLENGYYGVINRKGETILKTEFSSISDFSDKGKFIAVDKKGRKSTLFDSSGNALKTVFKNLDKIEVLKGGFFLSFAAKMVITDEGKIFNIEDKLLGPTESGRNCCESDSTFSVLAFESKKKSRTYYDNPRPKGVFKEITMSSKGTTKVTQLDTNYNEAVRKFEHNCFCGNILNPSDTSMKLYYRLYVQDSLHVLYYNSEIKPRTNEITKYNNHWGIVNFDADTLIEQFKYTDKNYWEKGVVLNINDSGFRFFNFKTSELSPFYTGTYNELYGDGDFYLLHSGDYYTVLDLNTFHQNDFNKKLKADLTPLPQSDIFKSGFKIFRDVVALVVNGKIVYYNTTGDKIWEQAE